MTKDAEDFLAYLLADKEYEERENGEADSAGSIADCTIYDVAVSLEAAVEKFCAGFREFLVRRDFDMSRLDYLDRSFGANCYCSLSGAGVGFFDEYGDPDGTLGDELQALLEVYSGSQFRFAYIDLYNHDLGVIGSVVNLAVLPKFLGERLEETFGGTNSP